MIKSGQRLGQKLFSVDNKVMRGFAVVFDLVILNALFLIGCMPILTIGVSLSAMYSVTLKLVKKENDSIVKLFIKAYKDNLKQGLLYGILALSLIIFLYMDLFYLSLLFPTSVGMIKIMIIALAIMIYLIYLYIFPLIARYEFSSKEVYQTALKISLSNLPWNLVLVSLNLPIIAMFFISGVSMIIMCLVMIVIGFSGLAYSQSGIFRKIFEKYE